VLPRPATGTLGRVVGSAPVSVTYAASYEVSQPTLTWTGAATEPPAVAWADATQELPAVARESRPEVRVESSPALAA
ncbi:MAG: hypothetical protein ACRDXX_10910, partial [Stackebrandtia sp.]